MPCGAQHDSTGGWSHITVALQLWNFSSGLLKSFACGQLGTRSFFDCGTSVQMKHPIRKSEGLSPHHIIGVALYLSRAV